MTIDENGFKFDPSVEDVHNACSAFCHVLSVTGDRSLPSSRAIFDLIKQDSGDPPSDYIQMKLPDEFTANVEAILRRTFRNDERMIRDALKEFDAFPKFLDKSVRIPAVISERFQRRSVMKLSNV